MNLVKNKYFPFFVIFLATLVFYLPIFINPRLFVDRNNDLQEFFWPIYDFVKEQILHNHQIPFWNNMILSGTPLLTDPQSPIFYLPNIVFLVLPISSGFIISSFLHTAFGGMGVYLAARSGLNLKKSASIFCAILFIFSPRLAGYLETGHYGLITSWAWLPWLFLSTVMIAKKPKFTWSIVFAISATGLFFTHTTTFIYACLLSVLVFLITTLKNANKKWSFIYFFLGGVLTFGLSAVTLLPQLEWIPQTNRYLLTNIREVSPIWNSKLEIIKAIFVPWKSVWQLDSEKWLAVGILPAVIAFMGFRKLKKIHKIILIVALAGILILAANNATPFYKLLLSQNWYVFARVSTRIWFVVSLSVLFLAGLGYQEITERLKNKKIIYALLYLGILEVAALSWLRILKPASVVSYAPKEVYEFLAGDRDRFRVYCTNRCLSQKDAVVYHLELIDGYSTLIQKNYNSHALQLTGANWDYYTLSIPPIGSFTEKLHPNINSLGEYNTKYIISPYEIKDTDLAEIKKIDKYFIYLNNLYQPRSPTPITLYSPNLIRIDTSNYSKKSVVVSEVYSKGWRAYADDGKELQIQEAPNSLRSIVLTPSTDSVELKYDPYGYNLGKVISLFTIILIIISIILLTFYEKRKQERN